MRYLVALDAAENPTNCAANGWSGASSPLKKDSLIVKDDQILVHNK
jgi:hypothetical protein